MTPLKVPDHIPAGKDVAELVVFGIDSLRRKQQDVKLFAGCFVRQLQDVGAFPHIAEVLVAFPFNFEFARQLPVL